MRMKLSHIASVAGGKLSPSTDGEREVTGFFTDSRCPSEEKLFLALRGERVDGNSFAVDLAAKGYCVMIDREEYFNSNGDIILVSDVRTALQELACYYRENRLSQIPFVGVTGSVGKTTTKEMIALALSANCAVHKTFGNFNSQIGLPQTVLACEENVDCAVVELGINMPGEMEKISRCAKPDISIITNIGYSHIENLGTREAIRDEKLKIAIHSKSDSILLLNGDEPLLRNIDADGKKLFYVSAENDKCHCFAFDIFESDEGISFKASVFGNSYNVQLNVCGKHFVMNSLFALATAHVLGLDVNKSAHALSFYKSDGKRQFVYEKNGHTVISDCYNASPESMKAALSVLKSSKGRRIAVLGDMLELGSQSAMLHQQVGEYVNGSADILVTFGDMAKLIGENCGISRVYSFSSSQRKELEELLNELIIEGDTVLYKASNGINLGASIV